MKSRKLLAANFLAMAAAFLLVVGLSIWYEVSVWTECRQTNSWFYGLKLMGPR